MIGILSIILNIDMLVRGVHRNWNVRLTTGRLKTGDGGNHEACLRFNSSKVELRCCLGDNDWEGAVCQVRELACQNGRKGQRGEQLTVSFQSDWGARWGIWG
jgi:hypothetical protein